jgi:hypothetical protein
LRDIRFLIAQGKIVEADYALDRFKDRIELVERHLRHRYLSAGMATSRGGKKSAANKWGGADGRAHEMHRMWQEQRTRGDSRGEADEAVARAFKVSTRTVRTARTKIGKQLSVSN